VTVPTRILAGILIFAVGFPIAVLAAVFGILSLVLHIFELMLAGISEWWHRLFVRLYGLDDK
jgi:hypothetical protein